MEICQRYCWSKKLEIDENPGYLEDKVQED